MHKKTYAEKNDANEGSRKMEKGKMMMAKVAK
jgi:hypothetical protein